MIARLEVLGLALTCALSVAACKSEHSEPATTADIGGQAASLGANLVILPASRGDQVRWLGFKGATRFWTPTKEDVQEVERNLPTALAQAMNSPSRVDDHAVGRPDYADYVRERLQEVRDALPRHRRQIIGIVDAAGTRKLLVRGFEPSHFPFEKWREEIVIVSDGGSDYWYVVYDPATGELVRFECNGEA